MYRYGMVTHMSEFSTQLAYWLKKRQLSQYELAKRVGTTPSAVTRWLQGKDPAFSSVRKIAQVLNVSLEQFFAPIVTDDERAA